MKKQEYMETVIWQALVENTFHWERCRPISIRKLPTLFLIKRLKYHKIILWKTQRKERVPC